MTADEQIQTHVCCYTEEEIDALVDAIRADGAAYVHTHAWEWVETVTGTAWTTDELAARHHPYWRVIHTPQEPE